MYTRRINALLQVPDLKDKFITNEIDDFLKKCLIYFEENYYNSYGSYGVLVDEGYKIQENILYLWDGKIFKLVQSGNAMFCSCLIDEEYFYKISAYLEKYLLHNERFTKKGLLNILRTNRLKFDDNAICKKIAIIHILKKCYDMRFNKHLFLDRDTANKWKSVNFAELIKVEDVINFGIKD